MAKTSAASARGALKNHIPSDLVVRGGKLRERTGKWFLLMLALTAIETMLFGSLIPSLDKEHLVQVVLMLIAYIAAEWGYYAVVGIILQRRMEIELAGFLLSSIGIAITASAFPDKLLTQLAATVAGIAAFTFLVWFIGSVNRVTYSRIIAAIGAVGLLAATLLVARYKNGAKNWLTYGSVSVQPSEFVKIAFIFVGAATLDRIQNAKSIIKYVVFSMACVGLLFLTLDFGTALIFFATFLIIAFLRSGDVKTIALVCAAALLGGIGIILYKPYVATRFANYRHVWEYADAGGFQQTRAIMYALSGGLFGVGLGNGKLRYIKYATEDLAFGVVCEELGMLTAAAILIAYALLLIYAIRGARYARSSFYAIAACSAAGLIIVQASLSAFGAMDILPFTGVTLPFISRGGSSMISSWGLLAFLKALDIRTYPKVLRELYHS
ncbi:MAG: FtsW/RodA/SpoVE family cell cycle protein [Clostridia bacterium]|nr:FtsW/RodA/SpoVE family cell cycle protein [Clostridia bacterium]